MYEWSCYDFFTNGGCYWSWNEGNADTLAGETVGDGVLIVTVIGSMVLFSLDSLVIGLVLV